VVSCGAARSARSVVGALWAPENAPPQSNPGARGGGEILRTEVAGRCVGRPGRRRYFQREPEVRERREHIGSESPRQSTNTMLASAPAPALPANVKAGAYYSPARNMWRDQGGNRFDLQGKAVV
jgi:hypothetical protein